MTPAADHVAERPGWNCRACPDPWPCRTAKIELQREFDEFPSMLVIHLYGLMGEAAHDLGTHVDMHDRFLGWISPVFTVTST